jgi:hypothetical protein
MEFLTDEIIEIIKYIVMSHCIILFILILSIFALKAIHLLSNKRKLRLIKHIHVLFTSRTEVLKAALQKQPRLYYHHIAILIPIICDMDIKRESTLWIQNREVFIKEMLPYLSRDIRAWSWKKRLAAAQFFALCFKPSYSTYIKPLITDKTLLVSLYASKIALRFAVPSLITQVILCFSKPRRIQRSGLLRTLDIDPQSVPCIIDILNRKSNVYIRTLCYQLLDAFLSKPKATISKNRSPIENIQSDMESANLDLQITACIYFVKIKPKEALPILHKKLHSPHWEVRAQAAKLLKHTHNRETPSLLEMALQDPHWWVRINAAETLMHLGSDGIIILKRQNPKTDQYAYDAAYRVLATLPNGG